MILGGESQEGRMVLGFTKGRILSILYKKALETGIRHLSAFYQRKSILRAFRASLGVFYEPKLSHLFLIFNLV